MTTRRDFLKASMMVAQQAAGNALSAIGADRVHDLGDRLRWRSNLAY
jgi:hypothetical protein